MTQSFDPPASSDSLSVSHAKIVNALESLRDCFTGASAPGASIRAAGMLWHDTTTSTLKIRNAADSAWIVLANLADQDARAVTGAFVFQAATYGTEKQIAILRMPFAATIVRACLISSLATSGSDGSNYWESYVRNVTAGNDLCGAKWTSNGSELTLNAAKDLAADQNLNVAKGDVLAGTIRSAGAPTNLDTEQWLWVLDFIPN